MDGSKGEKNGSAKRGIEESSKTGAKRAKNSEKDEHSSNREARILELERRLNEQSAQCVQLQLRNEGLQRSEQQREEVLNNLLANQRLLQEAIQTVTQERDALRAQVYTPPPVTTRASQESAAYDISSNERGPVMVEDPGDDEELPVDAESPSDDELG